MEQVVPPPGCLRLEELPALAQGADGSEAADQEAEVAGAAAAKQQQAQTATAADALLGSKCRQQPSQKLLQADDYAAVLLAEKLQPAKRARSRAGLRCAAARRTSRPRCSRRARGKGQQRPLWAM